VLPDLGQASTLDDLAETLRGLKVWAGDPSFETITSRVNGLRPAAEQVGKTTVVDCFRNGRRRLDADLVTAVVAALHPDLGYAAQWRQALRVVSGEIQAAAQVRVLDGLPPELPAFTGRAAELEGFLRLLGVTGHQMPHDVEGPSRAVPGAAGPAPQPGRARQRLRRETGRVAAEARLAELTADSWCRWRRPAAISSTTWSGPTRPPGRPTRTGDPTGVRRRPG
jgi:hypothetical protein